MPNITEMARTTLNLLAGSAPAVDKPAGIFTKRIWQPYFLKA